MEDERAKAAPRRRSPPRVRRTTWAPVATLANLFQQLDLAITLWEPGRWREIHERNDAFDLLAFELQYGVESERVTYNNRHLAQAQQRRRTILGQRAGLYDLFVPITIEGSTRGVLVTGPFQRSRPTAGEILERWRALSGHPADASDPEFGTYLESHLGCLTLDATQLAALRALVERASKLMSLTGNADELIAEIETLGEKVLEARFADRVWRVAQALVDARTGQGWASPNRRVRLWTLGIKKYPEHIAVCLFVNRDPDSDRLDELLRRDAFQRACVELARASGDAISGKLGGHGVTFLSTSRGSRERTRRRLQDLTERAATAARRRFGLTLHTGFGTESSSLSEQYQEALSAAELALSKGRRSESFQRGEGRSDRLGVLRRELGKLVEEKPSEVPVRFERYLEAAIAASAQRMDLVRVHFDAGFERVWEALGESDALDAKNLGELSTQLARTAAEARSVSDLATAYRRAVKDAVNAVAEPRQASRDRSLRRAEEYIQKHYREPLTLARVARVVGFAPNYFSGLFHRQRGVTFERYLIDLRVRRAQQLLAGTSLSLSRVAELSGCSTRQYFGRLFKRSTGETPLRYRLRVRKDLLTGVKPMLPTSE